MNPVTLSPGIGDKRPTVTLYYGQDVRATLRLLPTGSVHTVCTSPPYFGLRDYNREGQIGLESTPQEYAQSLVEVFREIKRVLRPDGTVWLNLGDSYAGYWGDAQAKTEGRPSKSDTNGWVNGFNMNARPSFEHLRNSGLKPKDLIGIPWRVAFALQDDGWYLRTDVIWAKGSCMPESVIDRPTRAHEYVFLLAHPDSGGRYYYDMEAIKEPAQNRGDADLNRVQRKTRDIPAEGIHRNIANRSGGSGTGFGSMETRNRRTVWNVNPKPYAGSHFAVWPPDLVRPMIRGGTSAHGVCSACGAQWERVIDLIPTKSTRKTTKQAGTPHWDNLQPTGRIGGFEGGSVRTIGWKPVCECNAPPSPAVVLDPFSGSGTTGMVAVQEGRNYIGIDLNEDYLPLAVNRVQELPAPAPPDAEDTAPMFELFGTCDEPPTS